MPKWAVVTFMSFQIEATIKSLSTKLAAHLSSAVRQRVTDLDENVAIWALARHDSWMSVSGEYAHDSPPESLIAHKHAQNSMYLFLIFFAQ